MILNFNHNKLNNNIKNKSKYIIFNYNKYKKKTMNHFKTKKYNI